MNNKGYIPALRFESLTKFFDPFLRITMPEKEVKTNLIQQANIKPLENILDFGCGTATLTIMIKEIQPKANVTGIDVDTRILKIAKTKIKKSGFNIKLSSYSGKKLPYIDGSFNKVLSSLVFHHLNRKQKLNILQEINRVLNDDGELYILDFGKCSNFILRVTSLIPRLLDGLENTSDNYNGMLPTLVRQSGFRNVEEKYSLNTIFGKLIIYRAKK